MATSVSGSSRSAPSGPVGIGVLLGAFLLLLPFLGAREIATRAEARIPLVGLDIVDTGRLFPPYLLGEPYLNKPPLHHLLAAGAIAVFGTHDAWAARIPSVVCGAICVWLTWLLGVRVGGVRVGTAAAAFLFLGYRFFLLSRSTQLEVSLAAATSLAYLGLGSALWTPAARGGWWVAAAGIALASLIKGPVIALLFPVVFLLADAVVRRSASNLVSRRALILVLGAAAGTALYYVPVAIHLGGVDELRRRLTFENVAHGRGFHYYLWQLPLGLLPAGLLLPWMIGRLRRQDAVARTCALALGIGVLVFSLSPSKQSHYLLPLHPLAGVWAAVSLREVWDRLRRPQVVAACAGVVLVAAGGWIADAVAARDEEPTAASIMRDYRAMTAGKPVAMLERHPVLAYHLDRRDLEFPASAGDAVRAIEENWGFLIVDLERGESLPAEARRLFPLNTWGADGHEYVLLTAARGRPLSIESASAPSGR